MSLRINFSLMTAGRGVYVLCQWLLLVVVARLADPNALGQFTYALALTSPLIIFAQFNMRVYMATDTGNEFRFEDYRQARLLSLGVVLALIFALALWQGGSQAAAFVIIFVGLYKAIESISDIYYGVLQKNEEFKSISVSIAVRGLLAVAAMLLALWISGSLTYAVIAIAVAWLVLLLGFDVPATNRLRQGRRGDGVALRAIYACLPFGLTLALMSLRINIPVYFIEHELSMEQVGYYSSVAYFMVAGRLVIGALVQTSAPRLATLYNGNDLAPLRRLLWKLLGLAAVLAIVGVVIAKLFGPVVLRIAYGASYAAYVDLLVLIMLATGIGYFTQLTGMCLTIARLRRTLIVSNVLGTAAVAVCAAILVPIYGLSGGAIALLIGTFIIAVLNSSAIWRALLLKSRESELSGP